MCPARRGSRPRRRVAGLYLRNYSAEPFSGLRLKDKLLLRRGGVQDRISRSKPLDNIVDKYVSFLGCCVMYDANAVAAFVVRKVHANWRFASEHTLWPDSALPPRIYGWLSSPLTSLAPQRMNDMEQSLRQVGSSLGNLRHLAKLCSEICSGRAICDIGRNQRPLPKCRRNQPLPGRHIQCSRILSQEVELGARCFRKQWNAGGAMCWECRG